MGRKTLKVQGYAPEADKQKRKESKETLKNFRKNLKVLLFFLKMRLVSVIQLRFLPIGIDP